MTWLASANGLTACQPTLAIFSAYDQKRSGDALRLHLIEHYDLGVIATSGLIRIAFSSVPTHSLTALVSGTRSWL